MIPRILSIAGTDPTGGAGIQADLKAIGAAGGYGMSVVTALVAQNTTGVQSIHTPPIDFLREQLESVVSDVQVDAVKIGMLGSADVAQVVSEFLERVPDAVVVLDPVMVATSGDRLLAKEAEDAVRDLATRVDVITPNLPELATLTGTEQATSLEEAIEHARAFAAEHGTTVIVKGGHLTGPRADNAVVSPDGRVHRVPSARIDTPHTHGTGCSLSSALATRLGAGAEITDALSWSTHWLHESITHAAQLEVGQGNGPVDHFHRARRLQEAASSRPWRATGTAGDPQIPAAGPHTAALWEATGDVTEQVMALPFIRKLADGTLSQKHFEFYLAQDSAYLIRYGRALAHLARTSPEPEGIVAWGEMAAGCIVDEREMQQTWLAGAQLRDEDISPITLAYTDHLLATTLGSDHVVGAAAVLPCAWLYAEVGLRLADSDHPDHPYHDWLDMYSGTDFLEAARAAVDRTERLLAAATKAQRSQAHRAYVLSTLHEREFFDQAERG